MKITPDLIPHKEFHNGAWLRSPSETGWYYFREGKNNNIIRNKDFLKSVDAPLRELVKLLHEKEIKTTPSCSGHCHGKGQLKSIYSSIEKDLDLIRQDGLELMDIETGKKILFREDEYALPWNKSDFVNKLDEYQHNGIIGIKPGRNKLIGKRLLELDVPRFEVENSGPIILLSTSGSGDENNADVWKKLTREIKRMLKG